MYVALRCSGSYVLLHVVGWACFMYLVLWAMFHECGVVGRVGAFHGSGGACVATCGESKDNK